MSLIDNRPIAISASFLPRDIFLVGCGGIGSHLAGMIAREIFFRIDLHRRHNVSSQYPNGKLVFVDGDTVEMKNLYRQDFAFTDINKSKSEALAGRYRDILQKVDVEVESQRMWVDEAIHSFTEYAMVLLCVDNNATRKAINNALSPHRNKECLRNTVLISGGNREQLATVHLSIVAGGQIITAPIEHNQPEITNPDDKHPRDASCQSEAGFVKDPQVFRANLQAATQMFQVFCNFLDCAPIDYCQIWSDVGTMDWRKEPIPPSKGWVIA